MLYITVISYRILLLSVKYLCGENGTDGKFSHKPPDASAAICDSYHARDPRVRVFRKPATGVSDTRNRALDLTWDAYIQFVDSDDWISPEATRLLVRSMEMNHCDMVISDFYRVSGEHLVHKGDISGTHVLTREEFSSFMIENPALSRL